MPVNYAALAEQARQQTTPAATPVDYSALASQVRTANPTDTTPKSPVKGEGNIGARHPGFFETLGEDVKGIPAGINAAMDHPGDTLKGIWNSQVDQHNQGTQAWNEGRYSEAVGHHLASALPVVGPAAAQAGEEIGSGSTAQGLAHATELLGPSAAKTPLARIAAKKALDLLPASKTFGPLAPNVRNAVQQADHANLTGVRTSVGQETGRSGLRKMEDLLPNYPGSSSMAEDFNAGQVQDLAARGRQLEKVGGAPNTVSGGADTNAVGSGKGIETRLTQRIQGMRQSADNFYNKVRNKTANNQVPVQTGVKDVEYPVLNPYGEPAVYDDGTPKTTTISNVPVMTTMETPVPLKPVRAQLSTVYDELKRNMPEAQRANSPAFRALDEFMSSSTDHMPAMDFDKFLGAVKAITRDGNSPLLSSQSQRLAKMTVKAGEDSLQQALSTAGPTVTQDLMRGRQAVRSYYAADEFLQGMQKEPAALYSHLVTGGDRVFEELKSLAQTAPNDLQTVRRTFTKGLIDKATAEGGFTKASGIYEEFKRMGPETKNLLYGRQGAADMDSFLREASNLRKAEGSATAGRLSAFQAHGALGRAMLELIGGVYAGHPGIGAAAAAAEVGRSYVGPYIMAKALLTPGGAKIMTSTLTLPIASPAFRVAMTKLGRLSQQVADTGRAGVVASKPGSNVHSTQR